MREKKRRVRGETESRGERSETVGEEGETVRRDGESRIRGEGETE